MINKDLIIVVGGMTLRI